MADVKTVNVLNQSRRLHLIGGVRIIPTEAKAVPEEATKTKAFEFLAERGELAIVDDARDPILDEDEARKEAARRKKEGERANTGAPVKVHAPSNKGRSGRSGKNAPAPTAGENVPDTSVKDAGDDA